MVDIMCELNERELHNVSGGGMAGAGGGVGTTVGGIVKIFGTLGVGCTTSTVPGYQNGAYVLSVQQTVMHCPFEQ